MPYEELDERSFLMPSSLFDREQKAPIYDGIRSGMLPADVLFKLRAIGRCEVDSLTDTDQRWTSLLWNTVYDIAEHVGSPDEMRSDTIDLVWGDLPDAVIDYHQRYHRKAYRELDTVYYGLGRYAAVIKRQRAEAGHTIKEVPKKSYCTPEELEKARCFGLARPIWRILVQRTHPEWLEQPDVYHHRTWRGVWGSNGQYSDNGLRRRIVSAAVFSDDVVYSIYNEARRTGVKRIGPAGRESLRELLADEHPELY